MQVAVVDKRTDKTITRDSGIELLKIIAIILIVISHVVQTLESENPYISYQDYILNLSNATTNCRHFILILFRHFGALGNSVFFVCSAWFLLRSSRIKKRKWFFMMVEIWVVSITILIVTFVLMHGNISGKIILKSLFPTLFTSNWYLTCYLLFYPITPLLNLVIKHLNKQTLFRVSAGFFLFNCCFGFIIWDWVFPSTILLWITIYFVMAYLQLYMTDFSNDRKKNCGVFILGMTGFAGIVLLTNILGLHISFFKDQMLHWATYGNPFLIIMAIAMFNIARNIHFKNAFINYISSLSLLIYIIHDNLILRTYVRPYMINYVYSTYGYRNIIFWVFVLVLIIFAFGVLSAVIYDKTLRRLLKKASDSLLYPATRNVYLQIEKIALRFH